MRIYFFAPKKISGDTRERKKEEMFDKHQARNHFMAYKLVRVLWLENLNFLHNVEIGLGIMEYAIHISHGFEEMGIFVDHLKNLDEIIAGGKVDYDFQFCSTLVQHPEFLALLDNLAPGYLSLIIKEGLNDLMASLIACGADPNAPIPLMGTFPIQSAILHGNRKAFTILFHHKDINLNAEDPQHMNPLITSMMSDDLFYVHHIVCHPSMTFEFIYVKVDFIKTIERNRMKDKENPSSGSMVTKSPSFVYLDQKFLRDHTGEMKSLRSQYDDLAKK